MSATQDERGESKSLKMVKSYALKKLFLFVWSEYSHCSSKGEWVEWPRGSLNEPLGHPKLVEICYIILTRLFEKC